MVLTSSLSRPGFKSDLRNVSTLLYCVGPEAKVVLVSTDDETKKYSDVVKKLVVGETVKE